MPLQHDIHATQVKALLFGYWEIRHNRAGKQRRLFMAEDVAPVKLSGSAFACLRPNINAMTLTASGDL